MVLLGLSVTSAQALNLFACEPEWGALATELTGDRASIYVATTASQDPHFIQARPSLIAEIRKTDLLICSGAELETGWLPLLLRRSGNPDIQIGQVGHFLAAEHVRRLEVPTRIDRGQGDIHPQGNPHVHLDPNNLRRIASALTRTLKAIDPAGTSEYDTRLQLFLDRWREATLRWKADASELAGIKVISHHRSFIYLANWLDIQVVADIEPKPGIPPNGGHLASMLAQFGTDKPALIIRTPYVDSKPSEWLSERLEVPAITLPYTVGGLETSDLFSLFDKTIELLKAHRS
jgi:zinc/manganese transport system substrate-binding protein